MSFDLFLGCALFHCRSCVLRFGDGCTVRLVVVEI